MSKSDTKRNSKKRAEKGWVRQVDISTQFSSGPQKDIVIVDLWERSNVEVKNW